MTHDSRFLDLDRCNFGGRMDHRTALILAASLLCGSVHAGYAQLAAPEGWSGGGGAAATYRYPSAANAASYTGGAVRAEAVVNVAGKAVTVPASMRMAANAGRIAAAAIYLHPGLRAVAAVATWIGAAGFVYDVATGLWKRIDPDAQMSDGFEWKFQDSGWMSSPEAACKSGSEGWAASVGYSVVSTRVESRNGAKFCYHRTKRISDGRDMGEAFSQIFSRGGSCPAGWYQTPAGCVQQPPMKTATPEEFERMVPDARPMPPELPGVVWPASWPVEVPEIQPMFIPTGNPVPNPKYDPSAAPSPDNQPYLQPGVKLSPAPTPGSPWQVDLQPVNRPVSSPSPSPDPVQDPVPNPDGSGDKDTPRDPDKDERDLCEKNPDILACQKMDEPEDPGKLPAKEIDFNFQPEGGFAGSASCPAPMTAEVNGTVYSISWQPFCNSLDMAKPFFLAMAWLSAAFIMLGARKE